MERMNPVLASSVISLSKSVFERISSPTPQNPTTEGLKFAQELEKVSKSDETFKTSKDLRKELLSDPKIKAFVEANPDNQIFFQKRADGSSKILSSSGDSMTIHLDSDTNSLVHQYFNKCVAENSSISPHRPDCVFLLS